ncbi:hypothetical protein, partial [Leisingera daeponensis]|uniref:hypothetical protein n=1 Tax=Leisingera daeponensis TaxID=405746 RepID=UPI001C986B84
MLDTTKLIYGFFVFRLFRYSYFHVAIGLMYFQSVGLSLSQALTGRRISQASGTLFSLRGLSCLPSGSGGWKQACGHLMQPHA